MHPSGATCLTLDCSELTLYKPIKRVGLVQGLDHHLI